MTTLLRDRRTQAALAVAVVVALVLAVALTRSGLSHGGGASAEATTSTFSAAAPPTSTGDPNSASSSGPSTPTSTSGAPDVTAPPADGGSTSPATRNVMVAMPDLPLDVKVSSTSGLHDGDTVTLHVSARDGSKVFGAEVRLCRAGSTIANIADFQPTHGANCIGDSLSGGSDARVEQAGAPPYSSLDVAFRVGAGTDTFTGDDGSPVTITCGPGHPCMLVAELQVPNGFGFQTYDLDYA